MARMLIIDDDEDFTTTLRMVLEARGHQVAAARNGTEGLRMVKAFDPEIVLLDVMMDTRTEGFHVSLELRDRSAGASYAPWRHVPILMLTSIHQTTPLRFAPDDDYLPVDALLEKSVRLDVIVAAAEDLLAKQQAR